MGIDAKEVRGGLLYGGLKTTLYFLLTSKPTGKVLYQTPFVQQLENSSAKQLFENFY